MYFFWKSSPTLIFVRVCCSQGFYIIPSLQHHVTLVTCRILSIDAYRQSFLLPAFSSHRPAISTSYINLDLTSLPLNLHLSDKGLICFRLWRWWRCFWFFDRTWLRCIIGVCDVIYIRKSWAYGTGVNAQKIASYADLAALLWLSQISHYV